MPGTGPRPAMKCEQGVLTWYGMNTTPGTMREARIEEGSPWDFYCCPIGGEIFEGGCSEPATFEAVPVPEPPMHSMLIVGLITLVAVVAWRKGAE